MRIAGLQKLTLLDFPEHTAATVFLPGCNFRCPFCHNAALVLGAGDATGDTPVEEFFAFLDKRHGLLDGVCITGGEPLLQPELADFCARIKGAGFAVKLDTNGSFPDRLRELVESELVDYVALDVKNAPERYAETVGVERFDMAPIERSISYLLSGTVPYEFRRRISRLPARQRGTLRVPHHRHARAARDGRPCGALPLDRRRPCLAPAELRRRRHRTCRPRRPARLGSRRPRGPPSRTAPGRPQHPAARRVEERTRRIFRLLRNNRDASPVLSPER